MAFSFYFSFSELHRDEVVVDDLSVCTSVCERTSLLPSIGKVCSWSKVGDGVQLTVKGRRSDQLGDRAMGLSQRWAPKQRRLGSQPTDRVTE